jgi:hypothetical protein
MPTLFRAMRKDDDRPAVSHVAGWGLGVRVGKDIEVDEEGLVHPGTGGTSVATAIKHLADHRRPPSHGGVGKHPIWRIEAEALPEFLVYEPDSGHTPRHGCIEPAYSMEISDFQEAIAGTRDLWEECT